MLGRQRINILHREATRVAFPKIEGAVAAAVEVETWRLSSAESMCLGPGTTFAAVSLADPVNKLWA